MALVMDILCTVFLLLVLCSCCYGEKNSRLDFDTFLSSFNKLNGRIESLENTVKVQANMINNFQRTVRRQNEMIVRLLDENKTFDEFKEYIEKRLLDTSNSRGFTTEELYDTMQTIQTDNKTEAKSENTEKDEDGCLHSDTKCHLSRQRIRKERLLLQSTTPVSNDGVAFFAYMSKDETSTGQHHPLLFDIATTNVGNGYHPHTGVFIAPVSGIYFFIWTVYLSTNSYHSTELILNTSVVTSAYLWTSSSSASNLVGFAIVNVNKDDEVYVRTHATYSGKGSIHSDIYGKSSFSGWKVL